MSPLNMFVEIVAGGAVVLGAANVCIDVWARRLSRLAKDLEAANDHMRAATKKFGEAITTARVLRCVPKDLDERTLRMIDNIDRQRREDSERRIRNAQIQAGPHPMRRHTDKVWRATPNETNHDPDNQ